MRSTLLRWWSRPERSWVRSEVCDQMANRLRHGQRIDLPGTTHTVPVDAPDALAAILDPVPVRLTGGEGRARHRARLAPGRSDLDAPRFFPRPLNL